MYIDFKCMLLSPLVIPTLRETHNRLNPVVGSSLVLVNLALMHMQQVMFINPLQLELQIRTLIDNLPPDMLYMYVGGQDDLLPQAKQKLKEDIWSFINGSIHFFKGQRAALSLIEAAAMQHYYVRANDVMDNALQPYLIVTVTPRV